MKYSKAALVGLLVMGLWGWAGGSVPASAASATPTAKKTVNDFTFINPFVNVYHQSATSGSCFGGSTEPCETFVATANFKCAGDCAGDLAAAVTNSQNLTFTISTSNTCATAAYTSVNSMNHFVVQNSKSSTSYTLPVTFQGLDGGRDYLLLQIVVGKKNGNIFVSGNGDFRTIASSTPLFMGFGVAEKVTETDSGDSVCVPVHSFVGTVN
jgi:hypothetical protein